MLLSPSQLFKVGPRRNCRKAILAICFIWNAPTSDYASQVQKKTDLWDQILMSMVNAKASCSHKSCVVFLCCQHVPCFRSWLLSLNVRNIEVDFALLNYVICYHCGWREHWWMFEKLHQNLSTSNNNPYPKSISLSPHIWQPQSFPFIHKYCSSHSVSLSHGNYVPSMQNHPLPPPPTKD